MGNVAGVEVAYAEAEGEEIEKTTTQGLTPTSEIAESTEESAPAEESEAEETPAKEDEEASAEGKESEEDGEEEAEEDEKKITVDDIKTAPMDFRFPTTNQAKHCYTRYNEYHKCIAEKGEESPDCEKYARYYRSICPGDWVDKWNEQRENGTFAGRY